VDWRLVDRIAKPAQFAAVVQETAARLAQGSPRPAQARGIVLPRIERDETADSLRYAHVHVDIDRMRRTATLTLHAPAGPQPTDAAGIEAAGAAFWPLALAREQALLAHFAEGEKAQLETLLEKLARGLRELDGG